MLTPEGETPETADVEDRLTVVLCSMLVTERLGSGDWEWTVAEGIGCVDWTVTESVGDGVGERRAERELMIVEKAAEEIVWGLVLVVSYEVTGLERTLLLGVKD